MQIPGTDSNPKYGTHSLVLEFKLLCEYRDVLCASMVFDVQSSEEINEACCQPGTLHQAIILEVEPELQMGIHWSRCDKLTFPQLAIGQKVLVKAAYMRQWTRELDDEDLYGVSDDDMDISEADQSHQLSQSPENVSLQDSESVKSWDFSEFGRVQDGSTEDGDFMLLFDINGSEFEQGDTKYVELEVIYDR